MKRLILAALLVLGLATPALAEPTTITVRALSKDAKFIGTGMGGVKVRLIDARSGKVLAEGLTAGGTGDTDRLVVQPRARQQKLSGEGDAAFTATLDITEPTLIRLEASGPEPLERVSLPIAVTSMAWVLPGQPVVGDGWVVEFPGLVIEPAFTQKDGKAVLTAKVQLMCGCPVSPGGLWDANHYKVTASIDRYSPPEGMMAWIIAKERHRFGGPEYIDVPLTYAGQPSTFRAEVDDDPAEEVWNITITAVDTRTGNTGVSSFQIIDPGAKPR